jgi:hypothetical protein
VCTVCMDAPRTVVFLPCRHMACCAVCSAALHVPQCPICRTPIEQSFEPLNP